jgi:hypothetical protein
MNSKGRRTIIAAAATLFMSGVPAARAAEILNVDVTGTITSIDDQIGVSWNFDNNSAEPGCYFCAAVGEQINISLIVYDGRIIDISPSAGGPDGYGSFFSLSHGALSFGVVTTDSVRSLGISDYNNNISMNYMPWWYSPSDFLYASVTSVTVNGVLLAPESSTWAMLLLGFAGLGYAGYRRRSPSPPGLGRVRQTDAMPH